MENDSTHIINNYFERSIFGISLDHELTVAHAVYPGALRDMPSSIILLLPESMVRIVLKRACIGRTICFLDTKSVLHIVLELACVSLVRAVEADHMAISLHHSVNELSIVDEVTQVITQHAMAVDQTIFPVSSIILILHSLNAVSVFLAVHELPIEGVLFASVLFFAKAAQLIVFPAAAVSGSIFDGQDTITVFASIFHTTDVQALSRLLL